MESLREQKKKLLDEYSPYAVKTARRAAYKWDLQADDVYQELMLAAWVKAEWALKADCPVAMIRSHGRFVIGHMVQNRYWRKGNGETDQIDDTFDAVDPYHEDPIFKIDVESSLKEVSNEAALALKMVWEYGYERTEVAKMIGKGNTHANVLVSQAYAAIAKNLGLPPPRTRERRDTNVYHFKHVDGRECKLTRTGMIKMGLYSSYVQDIVKRGKTRVGWSLASQGDNKCTTQN